jgi:hypothetical protein
MSSRRLRVPRAAHLLVLGVVCTLTAGCFSFHDSSNLYQVNVGYQSADVVIYRHATRELIALYDEVDGTKTKKTEAVAGVLRGVAGELPRVRVGWYTVKLSDRWNGATGPDQYAEIRSELLYTRTRNRCLAVMMDLGWGDVGYDWHTRPNDGTQQADGCRWGTDPVP